MTTTSSSSLEAIVRRIVDEVLAGNEANESETPRTQGRLCLRELRLITVANLEGRLGGITHVAAAARAVVTPAAQDLLREQGVLLERVADNDSSQASQTNKNNTIHIADVDCSQRASTFAKQLASRSGRAVEVVDASRATILLADVPQVTVAGLCRSGVEAAQVGSIDEASRVSALMQPKAWVIDTHRLSATMAVNVAIRLMNETT